MGVLRKITNSPYRLVFVYYFLTASFALLDIENPDLTTNKPLLNHETKNSYLHSCQLRF